MPAVGQINPIVITVFYSSPINNGEEYDLFIQNADPKNRSEEDIHLDGLISGKGGNELFTRTAITQNHKPLFHIVFYDRSLLTTHYDNQLIRHAYPQATIPPYALFHQSLFDDVEHEIFPIVHVFVDAGFNDIPCRFSRITDSSIWNYCIRFDSGPGSYDSLVLSFKEIVKEIKHNKHLGLYDLAISQEYADLNARLTRQAYISFGYDVLRKKLLNPKPGSGSGHGDLIAPFLFHSEHEMKQWLEEENKGDRLKTLIGKYKWRFLLVDDKIDNTDANGLLSSADDNSKLTKCDILTDRIQSIFEDPSNNVKGLTCKTFVYKGHQYDASWADMFLNDDETDIVIVCAETIEEATTLMKKYEFDIILLDYLLAKVNGKQEYGYSLLKEIYDKCSPVTDKVEKLRKLDYQIGPQGKYFFMFISAFTTAISERLNVLGLSRNNDIWEIGEGACPTNTPELFKYRLVHLMERRLHQTGIIELSEDNVLETVNSIFQSKQVDADNRIRSVRKKAYNEYNRILGFRYDYYLLRKHDKESRLIRSFLKDKVHTGAMLEHLFQLVHMTAFGTVRQWPEIWEEYQYFIRSFSVSGSNLSQQQLLSSISEAIEKHIIDLKSEP